MKIPPEIIEEVVTEVAGSDVLPVIRALKNKKNVSEFKLAESIKKEINATRNMLYRLYDSNLVSFVRKKDKVKGWYIYYWTFNVEHIKYLLSSIKQKKINVLKDRIEREKKGLFYLCQNACVRLDFDQATSFQFKCPECGQIVNQEDNASKIASLEKDLLKVEAELKLGIKVPVQKIKVKREKEAVVKRVKKIRKPKVKHNKKAKPKAVKKARPKVKKIKARKPAKKKSKR